VKNILLTFGFALLSCIANAQEPVASQVNKGDDLGIFLSTILLVFLVLFVLFIFTKIMGNYSISKQNKVANDANSDGNEVAHSEISGEVFAAISTAIYLYETEQHDHESAILTINRAAKNYSPWSSKIYGLRQTPQKESTSFKNKR